MHAKYATPKQPKAPAVPKLSPDVLLVMGSVSEALKEKGLI
jgi:hypothetical protein